MENEYPDKLNQNVRSYYELLGLNNIEERIIDRENRVRGKQLIAKLDSLEYLDEKMDVLDVGCGWGEMLIELQNWHKSGAVHGIEPDIELFELSNMVCNNVKNSGAESIPYSDNSFNMIIVNDVLEHVSDHLKSIESVLRVIKNKGYIYMSFPNYNYPAEAHYKVKILPFSNVLPKVINSYVIKYFRKRNPLFWEKYVTPISSRQFLQYLAAISERMKISYSIHDMSVYPKGIKKPIYGPINAKYIIQIDK